jgi:prolipoprotein diacylglyceryltransferase
MFEPNAFILGKIVIPWSAILIVFAILAWFFFAYSFAGDKKKERIAVLCMLPLSIAFSFFFCRLLYWYSNQSQYPDFGAALFSTSLTAFSLLGILPGIALSAAILRLIKVCKSLPGLLDIFAAPTALLTALFYLTCFFGASCRGKYAITNPAFTRFPVAVISTDALGNEQYRFATFFAGFALMSIVCALTLLFYVKYAKKKGATLCFFLLFYSAVQFILESTRYDAGYFPFNGFVSIIQIASAAAIVGATIFYSITAVKETGMRALYPILWVSLLLCIGATGYLEYLVQRHGDMAGRIYPGMALSCLGMALIPAIIYFSSKPQTEINDPNK